MTKASCLCISSRQRQLFVKILQNKGTYAWGCDLMKSHSWFSFLNLNFLTLVIRMISTWCLESTLTGEIYFPHLRKSGGLERVFIIFQ